MISKSKPRRLNVSDLISALKLAQQEGVETIVVENSTGIFSEALVIESVSICPSKDNQNVVLYIKQKPKSGFFSSLFRKKLESEVGVQ